MVYHEWGDKSFDWTGLNEAGILIQTYCKRWGRLGLWYKEKWGVLVSVPWFWDGTMHSLFYPGHASCQYPKKLGLDKFLWKFDLLVLSPIIGLIGLQYLVQQYQFYVYNKAFQKAVKKFPHLKEEILVEAFYPEKIKGAKEIQDKHYQPLE